MMAWLNLVKKQYRKLALLLYIDKNKTAWIDDTLDIEHYLEQRLIKPWVKTHGKIQKVY